MSSDWSEELVVIVVLYDGRDEERDCEVNVRARDDREGRLVAGEEEEALDDFLRVEGLAGRELDMFGLHGGLDGVSELGCSLVEGVELVDQGLELGGEGLGAGSELGRA